MHSPGDRSSGTRLLIICQGFPPYHGGAERAAGNIAREAAKGQEVHVLTSDIGGRFPSCETVDGVHVLRVPCRKRKRNRHSVAELINFYMVAHRRLTEVHRQVNPDHTLAVFTMPAGVLALNMAGRFGVPYSVVLQGSDVPGYQPQRFQLLHPLMKLVARKVWRGAAHVTAVSAGLAELARRTWPDGRIAVIPNGVDTESFYPGPARHAAETVKIILLSQLIERKGLHFLAEALKNMDPSLRARCRVEIFGMGPFRGKLEEITDKYELQTTIVFRGLLDSEHIPDALRAADIFILPSLQEGLPLSLMEAMASGLAVIATSVGDVPSVVTNGTNGLLVPPSNSEALQHAVTSLVESPDLRNRLGKEARRTAEKYSWTAIWKQYADLIGAHRRET